MRCDDLTAYIQAIVASSTSPSIASALRALHRDMTQLISEQIATQQSVGQLPTWISPTAMAQLIVAVVHGTLVVSVVDPERTDEAAIGAQFAHLLLEVRTTLH